ncbi:CotH kinase family protein [uncultured Duncaniella sp.]|uniref:CotH kinase family protein n=2 Tax=uncultured Duncaniella sp. TaxID=2768039 RepID=UPI0027315B90|nr:CotH kinase family protein [uncultured Duncaniella sp.]
MVNSIKVICYFLVLLVLFSCNDETEVTDTPGSSAVSGTLPVLYIDTENQKPIVSKEVYLNATYRLDPMGTEGIEALGSKSDPLPMQIRGRGHSSWKGPKKPYKIKLGKKTAIMGMPKNKHWALLKPTESTIAGLRLGELMGMVWTPSTRPVEVVLNGDYVGLYFLTETIRIDENRVNIFEQQDKETTPDLIKGGWLVEVDNYRDECQITIPENNLWNLTLRYHSPEDLSNVQLQWLTNEFKAVNAAIYSSDKTSTKWEEYIDMESMARFFILQEVMDNPDGFHGSFYLHKDLAENAKWVAGPIWDLSCYNREKTDYTFRMKVHYGITPHWIGEIIKYDNFCKKVKSVWEEVYPEKLSEIYSYIDETVLPLDKAWKNDYARWNEDPSQTAGLRADRIKTYLRSNMEWFDSHLPVSSSASL